MLPMPYRFIPLLLLCLLSACGPEAPPPASPPAPNPGSAQSSTQTPPLSEAQIEQSVNCISNANASAGKPLATSLEFLRISRGKPNNRYASGLIVLGNQVKAVNTQLSLSCV